MYHSIFQDSCQDINLYLLKTLSPIKPLLVQYYDPDTWSISYNRFVTMAL